MNNPLAKGQVSLTNHFIITENPIIEGVFRDPQNPSPYATMQYYFDRIMHIIKNYKNLANPTIDKQYNKLMPALFRELWVRQQNALTKPDAEFMFNITSRQARSRKRDTSIASTKLFGIRKSAGVDNDELKTIIVHLPIPVIAFFITFLRRHIIYTTCMKEFAAQIIYEKSEKVRSPIFKAATTTIQARLQEIGGIGCYNDQSTCDFLAISYQLPSWNRLVIKPDFSGWYPNYWFKVTTRANWRREVTNAHPYVGQWYSTLAKECVNTLSVDLDKYITPGGTELSPEGIAKCKELIYQNPLYISKDNDVDPPPPNDARETAYTMLSHGIMHDLYKRNLLIKLANLFITIGQSITLLYTDRNIVRLFGRQPNQIRASASHANFGQIEQDIKKIRMLNRSGTINTIDIVPMYTSLHTEFRALAALTAGTLAAGDPNMTANLDGIVRAIVAQLNTINTSGVRMQDIEFIQGHVQHVMNLIYRDVAFALGRLRIAPPLAPPPPAIQLPMFPSLLVPTLSNLHSQAIKNIAKAIMDIASNLHTTNTFTPDLYGGAAAVSAVGPVPVIPAFAGVRAAAVAAAGVAFATAALAAAAAAPPLIIPHIVNVLHHAALALDAINTYETNGAQARNRVVIGNGNGASDNPARLAAILPLANNANATHAAAAGNPALPVAELPVVVNGLDVGFLYHRLVESMDAAAAAQTPRPAAGPWIAGGGAAVPPFVGTNDTQDLVATIFADFAQQIYNQANPDQTIFTETDTICQGLNVFMNPCLDMLDNSVTDVYTHMMSYQSISARDLYILNILFEDNYPANNQLYSMAKYFLTYPGIDLSYELPALPALPGVPITNKIVNLVTGSSESILSGKLNDDPRISGTKLGESAEVIDRLRPLNMWTRTLNPYYARVGGYINNTDNITNAELNSLYNLINVYSNPRPNQMPILGRVVIAKPADAWKTVHKDAIFFEPIIRVSDFPTRIPVLRSARRSSRRSSNYAMRRRSTRRNKH